MKKRWWIGTLSLLLCVALCGCEKLPELQTIPEKKIDYLTTASSTLYVEYTDKELLEGHQRAMKEMLTYIVQGVYVKDSMGVWMGEEIHSYNFLLTKNILGTYPEKTIVVSKMTGVTDFGWKAVEGREYMLLVFEYNNVYEEEPYRQLVMAPMLLDETGEIEGTTQDGVRIMNILHVRSKEQLLRNIGKYASFEKGGVACGTKALDSDKLGDIAPASDLIVTGKITGSNGGIGARESYSCEVMNYYRGSLPQGEKLRITVPKGWLQKGEAYMFLLRYMDTGDGQKARVITSGDEYYWYAQLTSPTNSYFPLSDTEKVAEVERLVQDLK